MSIVELSDSRGAQVGALPVRRALPRHGRRTVGAWCFLDHMGPVTLPPGTSADVAAHPHIGLQTVTWLLAGELVHRDSLGSEQAIRPGQLNLMTAGHGVAHSEEGAADADPAAATRLHGVQLWVAQPEATRHGPPAFEHHDELPRLELGNGVATVLVGALGEARSVARRDTDHVGAELALRPGRSVVALEATHEHAAVVLEGAVELERPGAGGALERVVVEPGHLAYLGSGRDELAVTALGDARTMLIGGAPFGEEVLMFWNYVARTRDEIRAAHEDWQAATERFGVVHSSLPRIPSPEPPWP